jgi:AcrR family transcriptional regulator
MVEVRQERALQTRQTLLLAAAEVFDQYGYSGASINRILGRAGLTAGALYFHFSSKEELARAVMSSQPEAVVPWPASTGLQLLVDITLVWARRLQVDPLLRAGVRLTNEWTSAGIADGGGPYRQWAAIMADCLRGARDLGELKAGVDPEGVAEFVVEACTGMQMFASAASGRADLVERATRMWRLLLPGLAVPEAAARTVIDPARTLTHP